MLTTCDGKERQRKVGGYGGIKMGFNS